MEGNPVPTKLLGAVCIGLLCFVLPLTVSSALACQPVPSDYMRADVIVEGWVDAVRFRSDLGVRPLLPSTPIYVVSVEIPFRVQAIHRGALSESPTYFVLARSDPAGAPELMTPEGPLLGVTTCDSMGPPPKPGSYMLGAFRYGERGLLHSSQFIGGIWWGSGPTDREIELRGATMIHRLRTAPFMLGAGRIRFGGPVPLDDFRASLARSGGSTPVVHHAPTPVKAEEVAG